MKRPLILVTNDDGIDSVGLWAAVEAVLPLGHVLVVAPDCQWSGGGRSMPSQVSGRYERQMRIIDGEQVIAYAVDASPALAVQHGVLEFAPYRPSLVVSGINYGLNIGTEVTISGTVGAALEGAAFGIPALALSLDMASQYHLTGDATADYAAAVSFARRFAWYQLIYAPTRDVDVLSINLPADATPTTPWRLTHLSRRRYFIPSAPDRQAGQGRPNYRELEDMGAVEVHSDLWAVKVERIVSVTPLSLDLTSQVQLDKLDTALQSEVASCQSVLDIVSLFSSRGVESIPAELETGVTAP